MSDAPSAQPAQAGIGHDSAAARAVQALRRGVAAAGQGNAGDAIAWCRQAVALQPDFPAAHANLGLLLAATGANAEAEPHLRAALLRMPGDAALHDALGVAQEATGRLAHAEASYRAALAAQPALADAHTHLGNCLRRLGRLDEARQHCARAVELAPGLAVASFNLGLVLQELGALAEAAVQYRHALALRPDWVEVLNNLSNCVRKLGALDEARAALERVLELRPDNIEAHCNLGQLKKYVADDPHIALLLAQEHRLPSLPAHGQIRYWFTVGKMMEDIGRHDDSFAAYDEGNRLKRAQTPWDEAAHADLHRRIVATFTRGMMARHVAGAAADGPVPVFIVGMPRSGTSLIEQVLATLPGVHGAGEITSLGEVLQAASADHPAGEFRFPETMADYAPEAFRRLGRRYVDQIRALAPQATHVVDKLPANFSLVGAIHLMFPNARVIHAMRDPMDSCFSCYSRLFSGENLAFTYELGALARFYATYHATMQHWHAVLPPGRVLDMRYETMVADFENQARRLVDYLGLPWDDRCLGFHKNARVSNTASIAQVRKPIYRTSVARWTPYERHLGPLREVVEAFR